MLLLSVKKLGHEVSVLPMAFMEAQGPLSFIRCLSTQELWVECEVSKILKGKVSNKSLVVLVEFFLVEGGTGLLDSRIPQIALEVVASSASSLSLLFSLYVSLLPAQVVLDGESGV